MKFKDIPQFPKAYYSITSDWKYLEETLDSWDREETPLILNPDFQRGCVWNKAQKASYVEYIVKGGSTGRDIYFNCSSWQGAYNTPIYCVDGLQRLTAAREFMKNEFPIFGNHFYEDFEDKIRVSFVFNVLNIRSKRELLKIYLDFNSGGTIHSKEELEKVKKMIEDTPEGAIL